MSMQQQSSLLCTRQMLQPLHFARHFRSTSADNILQKLSNATENTQTHTSEGSRYASRYLIAMFQ